MTQLSLYVNGSYLTIRKEEGRRDRYQFAVHNAEQTYGKVVRLDRRDLRQIRRFLKQLVTEN